MPIGGFPDFEWDESNVEHLARHGISPEEVEELFLGRTIRLRMATDAPDRVPVLGRTLGGRYLLIICQQKAGSLIRPFTGRDMRPHERRIYERQTGG
jgi:uncharacterized DUF497 family protein